MNWPERNKLHSIAHCYYFIPTERERLFKTQKAFLLNSPNYSFVTLPSCSLVVCLPLPSFLEREFQIEDIRLSLTFMSEGIGTRRATCHAEWKRYGFFQSLIEEEKQENEERLQSDYVDDVVGV